MTTPYFELLQQIQKLQSQATTARKREVTGVIKRIREAIKRYDLTPDELFPTDEPRTKKPLPRTQSARRVKYADEHGNKWTGSGSKPVWLRNKIAEGRKIEDFLVVDKKIDTKEKRSYTRKS